MDRFGNIVCVSNGGRVKVRVIVRVGDIVSLSYGDEIRLGIGIEFNA